MDDVQSFLDEAARVRGLSDRKRLVFTAPNGLDDEQELMAVMVYHLGTLTPRARRRVIAYVESRLEESEDA